MPASSMALMFSMVPYLVSPVTWRGRSFQRKRIRKRRSRMGWLCMRDLIFRPGFRWKLRPRHVTGDTKYGTKDEIAHGLVIHDFRRRHQHLEDDPGFAAIDDIVGMIPQMRASP